MALQEITQQLKNLMQDTLRDLHTVIPGQIVSFDPDKGEAAVLPSGKFKKPDGSFMDFPQISDVPVYFIQGATQTATVVYPIKKGDGCLLFFSEQALDVWRTGAESNTDLRFDLTNAIAIVGLFIKANPLVREACQDDALIIDKGGQRVKLRQDGDIEVTGINITINAQSDVKINAGGNITMQANKNVNTTAENVSTNADKVISLSAPNNPDGVFSAVGWTASVVELKP